MFKEYSFCVILVIGDYGIRIFLFFIVNVLKTISFVGNFGFYMYFYFWFCLGLIKFYVISEFIYNGKEEK